MLATQVTIPQAALTYAYSTAGGVFNDVMATHINTFFSPHTPVTANQVITTTGLTPMHHLLGLSLADPGEGILVSRPIYGRFELDFGNVAGLKVVYTDQDGTDAFEDGIVECYERALIKANENGTAIRAVLIVNPNNPVGMFHSATHGWWLRFVLTEWPKVDAIQYQHSEQSCNSAKQTSYI